MSTRKLTRELSQRKGQSFTPENGLFRRNPQLNKTDEPLDNNGQHNRSPEEPRSMNFSLGPQEALKSCLEDIEWEFLNNLAGKYGFPLFEGSIVSFVTDHLPDIIGAIIIAVPSIILKLYADHQQRVNVAKLNFFKSVNFSISWIEYNGITRFLKFATINEVRLEELVHENSVLVKETLKEAAKLLPEQPVMFVDYHTAASKALNKAAQNIISQQFAEGHVDRAVKKPMEMHRFYLAYTFETDDRVPQRKIRVMLCSESLLNSILKDRTPPAFARPSHAPRWDTLLCIADLYRSA
eukprot:gene2533-5453_t